MSWARLDDGFYDHPKVLATSNAAIGLYCKAITYATKHLTDGVIPTAIVTRTLAGTDAEIDELLRNKLWKRYGESFEIVNYLAYQLSSKSVKKERKRAKEGMRALRARRATGVTRNTGWDGMGSSSSDSSEVKEESEGKTKSPDPLEGFAEWYAAYPRKEALADAKKAWRQMARDRPALATMLHALAWQKPIWAQKDRQYTPLPGSYLRAERWNDEPPPGTRMPSVVDAKPLSEIKVHPLAARLNAMGREVARG